MFLMLVAAGALYFFMGEPIDALMLLGFAFVVLTITVVPERRTERALDALRDLSSPRALVVRDGEHRRIPGREVVRGDILVLSEGDRVAADAIRWMSRCSRVNRCRSASPLQRAPRNWTGREATAHSPSFRARW